MTKARIISQRGHGHDHLSDLTKWPNLSKRPKNTLSTWNPTLAWSKPNSLKHSWSTLHHQLSRPHTHSISSSCSARSRLLWLFHSCFSLSESTRHSKPRTLSFRTTSWDSNTKSHFSKWVRNHRMRTVLLISISKACRLKVRMSTRVWRVLRKQVSSSSRTLSLRTWAHLIRQHSTSEERGFSLMMWVLHPSLHCMLWMMKRWKWDSSIGKSQHTTHQTDIST